MPEDTKEDGNQTRLLKIDKYAYLPRYFLVDMTAWANLYFALRMGLRGVMFSAQRLSPVTKSKYQAQRLLLSTAATVSI